VQSFPGMGLVEQMAVGPGSDRKAVGHAHALRAQFADHFAQRGVLAADLRDIGDADV